jgi:hypothetical protein
MTEEEPRTGGAARRTLVAGILAITIVSVAFRVLRIAEYDHTALVFIGIPALLALALVGIEPKTSTGTTNKVIALALCMSGILFGEAFICIVMVSPLFFLMGSLVSWLVRWQKKRVLGLVLVPLSLEGVLPRFEMAREEVVIAQRVVMANPQAVRATLAAPMQFDATLPPFFSIGFPTPGATSGSGLALGDQRSVEFVHGHHPGTLVLEITTSTPDSIVFTAVSDDSYITHWLAWRSAEVRLQEVAPGQTLVTWTLRYRRRLDPAWYFTPLERYGVGLAAEYLLQTLTNPTPVDSRLTTHPPAWRVPDERRTTERH